MERSRAECPEVPCVTARPRAEDSRPGTASRPAGDLSPAKGGQLEGFSDVTDIWGQVNHHKGCPMRCRVFSLPGLSPLDASSTPLL